jgi:hypothetical protein
VARLDKSLHALVHGPKQQGAPAGSLRASEQAARLILEATQPPWGDT